MTFSSIYQYWDATYTPHGDGNSLNRSQHSEQDDAIYTPHGDGNTTP